MSASQSKPVVVKIGGGALAGGALEDVNGLLESGVPVALVHGGGPRLTRILDALKIPSEFKDGMRVTSPEAVEIAEMVFAGEVNGVLVRELYSLEIPAAGISGTDGPTLRVEPIKGLGRVGRVVKVDTRLVETLWTGGFVPVIAPLGIGPEGVYNVNADLAAAAIAVALGAGHVFFLTDVDGLLQAGEVVEYISPGECEGYVESGLAASGMVPKLRASAEAARGGVAARIVNGNTKGALAAAVAGKPVGTLISERTEGVVP